MNIYPGVLYYDTAPALLPTKLYRIASTDVLSRLRMKLIENADIVRLRGDLVDGMTDYMIGCAMHSESGAGYTQESIERCDAILDAFLTSLEDEIEAGNPEKILNVVKDAVMAVNVLNDECGGGMIETDQREQLCDIIIFAANEAGLITDEDITLAWREW